MIPAALAEQLQTGIADFLRMSFWSPTPGMSGVIDRLLDTPGAVLKGPYISAKLPFEPGRAGDFFPKVPLGFPAHLHQEQAFMRLSAGQSTLVATGTGSGKTESFLWPILDACRRQAGTPGIKAILVYPMNALATDQAKRIAQAIHQNPHLHGGVRAGLYIGQGKGYHAQKSMGPDTVITDHSTLQHNPPDILLTNYKMLDYLLIRPSDQGLWQHNLGDPLRFLVVDELHTFDGAQGTDLACLLRRLKSRLSVKPGTLCCVGTSATLGGGDDGAEVLRAYAQDIFGEPFTGDAVIREHRMSPTTFFVGKQIPYFHTPPDASGLDPSTYATPQDFVLAQYALWFARPLAPAPLSDPWRVALGIELLRHMALRRLLTKLADGPVDAAELAGGVWRDFDPPLARLMLGSFLSLVSEARSWLPEDAAGQKRRKSSGLPRRTRPFLEVRLQLWQRELRRMVADVTTAPTLCFSDDLTGGQRNKYLPLVHCRDCGAMGWATRQDRDKPELYRSGLRRFYRGFFGGDPQVRFLWPAAAAPSTGTWTGTQRFWLDTESLTRLRDPDVDPDTMIQVVVSHSTVSERGTQRLSKDCPFCAARGSLTLVGFRAATLTSVYIDQIFASRFNDDKKLLTFVDSVQDAAHRAGFFGARTWRFNLRVALQQVLDHTPGVSLEALPDAFTAHWRAHFDDDAAYVTTFLAPNMEWFSEYEALCDSGELPKGGSLLTDVGRRLAFEIFTEFGHQARIGRSLVRTGSAAPMLIPERLQATVDELLPILRNEMPGMRALKRQALSHFVLGACKRLLERGGLNHRGLPSAFVESGGRDTHSFIRAHHLPRFGLSSRLPALLSDDPKSPRFDAVLHSTDGWYARWARLCLSPKVLIGEASDVWNLVLPILVNHDLLRRTDGKHGSAWGLCPTALQISTQTTRLRCDTCAHWQVIAQAQIDAWAQMPCLSGRCTGHYLPDSVPALNYFGQLYARGQVARVFAEEHTGLLDRTEREAIEVQFKAEPSARKPWFPNLLSCTPTLEMGIDIGALSAAILCSVPPTQANYLQRIGRTGRRDGNSLLLTMASGKPHDLYFYAKPEAMLAGQVDPPGVFLNASAVLERQLAAFTLDQWNQQGVAKDAIPRRLTKVFDHLNDKGVEHFPHNWLSFVRGQKQGLLAGFFALFGARINAESQAHLKAFLVGDQKDQGSLGWKVLDILQSELKQRNSLKSQTKKIKSILDKLKKTVAQGKGHEDELHELESEQVAIGRLVSQIQKTPVLEFLTNHGLLPNYAFPESPIRLRSVIWRRRARNSTAKSKYETYTYEYVRPAMAALSELAPDNRFFAGGRHVTIDQVDMATSSPEPWRFCDQCSFSKPINTADDAKDCPSCGSQVWGEDSQKGQLLRLEQVFANTNDRDSRIRDEREERQPKFYNQHMLVSFESKDRDGAWHIDEPTMPFAFEYLRRARFQEINFGERTDEGTKFMLAGRDEVRPGFSLCLHCGKVQPKPPKGNQPPLAPVHALWCKARSKGPEAKDFEVAVYLYREFSSEAIRLLLPLSEMGTQLKLNSFLAAFQLGLKDKYGGRVDHLQTLVYSEPEGDGHLRRQYLVLYDTVPGGTGYLKDFTRAPDDDEALHPLLDILKRSLHLMSVCDCVQDPDKDGCYRCLFAYRNSRDMADTSQTEAVELYSKILEHADQLVPIDALSDVSVSGLMDSVLEARFIEALRHLSTDQRPIQITKRIVRNKPGYQITVDSVVWNVEQQVNLDARHGIDPSVSIDFVFHPGSLKSDRKKTIAVFLDGFQFHRDRAHVDYLQRMTLIASRNYDVWSFSWQDVDQIFHTDVEPPLRLIHPDLPKLKLLFSKLGIGPLGEIFDRQILDVFVDNLVKEQDWQMLAAASLFAQCKPAKQIDIQLWDSQVDARIPQVAKGWFNQVSPDWLRVHRPPTEDTPFGLWAAAPTHALSPKIDPDGFRLLVWLDDHPDRWDTPNYHAHWRGTLRVFQYLSALPHGWFLTTQTHNYQPLHQMRSCVSEAWEMLDADPSFAPITQALSAYDLPLPEVGIELPNARGYVALEGELVWADLHCAVVIDLAEAESPVASNWHVFERDAVLTDIQPLLSALTGDK